MSSGLRNAPPSAASASDVASAIVAPVHLVGMSKQVRHLQARVRELERQNAELRQSGASAAVVAHGSSDPRPHASDPDPQGAAASEPLLRIARFANAIDAIGYEVSNHQTADRMYQEVCQACVEGGGFRLAWLGVIDSETRGIDPVEVAGVAAGYLEGIVSGNGLDVSAGLEPSAIACREKRLYLCNDIEALPVSEGWCNQAVAAGLRSVLAVPIYRGSKVYAALTAYGPTPNFLDAETVRLFENMADCVELVLDEFDAKEQQRLDAENLRQSEERFRTLVENLPLKIFVKDASDNYVSCNGLFARDLGIAPEGVIGKTDFDFYSPTQAEQFRREDQTIIATGEGMDLHVSTLQDGVEKIVHVIKTPFKNAAGQIVGVIGAIVDITERKQAELKLRQFAYEVEDVYQNAPCGYHSIDAEGRFQRVNNTALQWLGYKREEVVGRLSLFDVLSEASRQAFAEMFFEFKKTGVLQDVELEMVRKDGCILPVKLDATAVYDDSGNFVSGRAMIGDVSVRRELEREQRMQARRLNELSHRLVAVQEDERRRLAGELHDRATPNLVAIQLTLSNLAASLPDGVRVENGEYFDDIQALLEDTTASIREICTELRPPLLDYSGLVPTLEAYAQQVGRRTGVLLSVDAHIEGSPLGRNVESLLFRIVQEAVANSVKHAYAKHIHIHLSGSDRHTVLTIKDDGVGFSHQLLGSAGAVSGRAPGLGLITMRERAEFAGGQLSINSQPGGGTEIRVEFDAVERRANLTRRHTDHFQEARHAPEAASVIPRQYANGVAERRSGQCRRRPESAGNPLSTEPGFVERRASISRRRQDTAQTGLAAQFRFS